MNSLYLIANIVFLPFDSRSGKTLYIKGGISGLIFIDSIWTKEEILAQYPDAKECKNLHEVTSSWGSRA